MEEQALVGLDASYFFEGQYKKAIDVLQKQIEIINKTDNQHEKAITLNRLGNSYLCREKHDIAIKYFQEALKISKNNSFWVENGKILNNLGVAYGYYLHQCQDAIRYFKQALTTQF